MKYAKYPGEKTYVVFHTEGTGEQGGAPIVEKEKLESFDTMDEAIAFGDSKYPRITGWEWDNYTVNINMLTAKGKEEYAELEKKWAIIQEDIKNNPDDYHTVEGNGIAITFKHNPIFDGPKQ